MSSIGDQIDEHCRHLRLRGMAAQLEGISETDPKQFLLRFLQLQAESRDHTRIDRAIKSAGFYMLKHFDDFRFDEVKLPAALTPQALCQLQFVDDRQNLICYGNVGTGNYVKRLFMQSCLPKLFRAKDDRLGNFA